MKNKFESLVPNPGYARGRTSLHLKTMDYYWKQKYVVGRALVEMREAHEAILLKLDELSRHLHQITGHLGIKLADFPDSALDDTDIKLDISQISYFLFLLIFCFL